MKKAELKTLKRALEILAEEVLKAFGEATTDQELRDIKARSITIMEHTVAFICWPTEESQRLRISK